MVLARRAFLDGGHYEPLRDELVRLVEPGSVLDVGCGEGYYTRPLAEPRDPNHWIGGIDLSLTAIRLAARRTDGIHYAVANAFDLPVVDESIDTAVNVFSPIAPGELIRVTTPAAHVITVTPGPGHLAELKQVLFETPTEHTDEGPLDDVDGLAGIERHQLTIDMHLDQPALRSLVGMTPYQWQLTEPARQRLAEMQSLDAHAEFLIHRYARR
jgi:23S rRNA (guanine745-N1)-methyltransferase